MHYFRARRLHGMAGPLFSRFSVASSQAALPSCFEGRELALFVHSVTAGTSGEEKHVIGMASNRNVRCGVGPESHREFPNQTWDFT